MHHLRLLYLLFLLLLPSILWAQKQQYQIAPVAFYNLENFFNPEDNPDTNDDDFTPNGANRYTEAIFAQKAENMAKVIAQLGTDLSPDGAAIIGVCEVEDDRALKKLLSQTVLQQRGYKFIRINGPDKRGINVALIYSPKYFKLLSAQSHNISLAHVGGGITRDVLVAKGVLQGDTVFVMVNHWPSRGGGAAASSPKRQAAAAVNKRIIDSISTALPNAKIILMGDLNDDPTDISVAKVLGATGRKDKAIQTGNMYNPWLRYYERGVGTLSYNDKWNLFDQIIISPAWLSSNTGHWQYYQSRVFDKDFLKSSSGKYKAYPHRSYSGKKWINGYSDHFPTVLYFIKDAPAQPSED